MHTLYIYEASPERGFVIVLGYQHRPGRLAPVAHHGKGWDSIDANHRRSVAWKQRTLALISCPVRVVDAAVRR